MRSMRIWVLGVMGLIAATGCAPKPALAPDPDSWRYPPAGPVVGGKVHYGAHAWLGIPYAEPPTGALRWRAPQAAKPWVESRAAFASGPACPQYSSPFGGVEGDVGEVVGSEDCLTLDIYAPAVTPGALPAGDKRLPVMVWIHGGGNSIGTARNYTGAHLAVDQNVIVVNIQYRLGPLGWFRANALRKETSDPAEQSGNFGMLDQILALQWVRDNIAAFGGNPDNVTIFGESAGGRNVLVLLMSPLAKGLFHRAISQSGAASCGGVTDAEAFVEDGGLPKSANETLLALFASDVSAGTQPLSREAAKAQLTNMGADAVREYLRAKSPAELLGAFKPTDQRLLLYPQVFADGHVIPAGCADVFTTGEWNKVPVMVGANRDEAKLFMFANPKYIKRLFGLIPRYVIEENDYLVQSDYASRVWRMMASDTVAQAMAPQATDIYLYRFDWDELPTAFGADLAAMLGAAHGFEIPFVFGHFDLGKEAQRLFPEETLKAREGLSKVMMAYWGGFARDGKPGLGDGTLPKWKPFAAGAPARMLFDTPAGGGVRVVEDEETIAKLIADAEADKRLAPDIRCALLQAVAQRSNEFTPAKYTEREDCKAYPYKPRTEL